MNQIREIFAKSQENISTHQKLIQSLRAICKSTEIKSVSHAFLSCLDILFCEDYKINKNRRTRTITLIAQFLLDLLSENSDEESENPFVRAVVDRALQHIDIINANCRYHATLLLETLLKNIRIDIKVSTQLCDDIQYHLIERFLTDLILPIRLISASALVRLQDLENPRCPVIQAYMEMCCDSSPMIRKQAVMHLAITHASYETLIRAMRDVDTNVRLQAFKRVSSMNPTFLKIVQRQQVIMNGIDEEQISVRKAFLNTLLPKWLQMYEDNMLLFYNSLRLDAQINDIEETRVIHEELMKIFFQCFSAKQILQYLPIGEDCLVPIKQLTLEISAYWYHFVLNLQKEENCGIEVETVLPQLTSFCEYIRSVLKSKEGQQMKEWQRLQFQEVLYNLFRLVSISDLADEVGRKNLQPLLRETLVNTKLEKCVIGEVLETYKTFFVGTEQQCEEICSIMSDIREPIHINQEESVEMTDSQKMMLSQLKAKIHILEAMVDQAIEEKKFKEAEKLHDEINEVKKKIEEMNTQQIAKQPVRELQLDTETMCRSLDILTMFTRSTKFQALPSALRVCLNEFVKPGIQIEDVSVHGRIFLVMGQFCVLDRNLAFDDAQYLCSPLVATKYGRYDKNSIIASLQAVSDMIKSHGPDILGDDEEDSLSVGSVQSNKSKTRRLYQEVAAQELIAQCMNVTRGLILDIILDLLDEEDDDIRYVATVSLMKLVMKGLLVNPSLLTRLILKWLNPYLEKHDPKIQQTIGKGLVTYAMTIKNSCSVIQRTIIPTLNNIGNAPDNSPFQDVEIDHVVYALCNMTLCQRTDISGVHKSLALEILRTIKNRPKAKSIYILSKMLLVLERPQHPDENFVSECLENLDIATQYVADVKVIKVLLKYKKLLCKVHTEGRTSATVQEETVEEGTDTVNELALTNGTEDLQQNDNTNKENENPKKSLNGSLIGNNSGNASFVNTTISDSQSSMESVTPARKRVKRAKATTELAVIIERSSEVDRLSLTSESSDTLPVNGSSIKRKRGRTKRTSRNHDTDESQTEFLEGSNTSASLQSSPVMRSSQKSSAVSSPSSHSMVLTRSSCKTQKLAHHLPSDSSDGITPRRSGRKKTKKVMQ